MGESACLMRSFSQLAETCSHGANEGRALTESISFGRFMSESLAWEKFSTFSHNRYLEEVEQFSKPGSVAQMKAFFEAHYKKRAAMKTQTMLEKANATGNCVSEVESLSETQKDSSVDSEETQRDKPHIDLDYPLNERSCDRSCNEITHVEQDQALVQPNIDTDNCHRLDIATNHFQTASPEDKMLNKGMPSSKGRRSNSSHGRVTPSEVIKNGNDSDLNRKKSLSLSKDQNRSTPESLHNSNSFASRSCQASKKLLRMPGNSPRNRNIATSPDNKKTTGESNMKKRLNPISVHMSISFASSQKRPIRSSTTQKAASLEADNNVLTKGKASPGAVGSQKRLLTNSLSINLGTCSDGTSKTSLKMAKDDSNSARCSTRASVTGLTMLPLKNQQPEDKRNNTIVGSSISGGLPISSKRQSSVDRGKLLSPSGSKARSSTVSSPFSFRSDERAEKRKEFFKRLEEKNKEKEAVNEQLQTRSKIPLARPSSSSVSNHDRTSRPPKSSASVNTKSPKNIREKYKQIKIHPSTPLPKKKKTHENSSPNIQR